MIEKFKNKYRIESTRLPHWNYGWNGTYFITICTKYHVHYLGDITNNKMKLSEIGEIAAQYWKEIPEHFSFVKLGEFIIMPNHVHGIIIIDKPDDEFKTDAETLHATSLLQARITTKSSISPKSNSLSTIIRSYRSAVTRHVRLICPNFIWQPRFYDHIIRNQKSYNKISEYILNKWEGEKYHSNPP